MANKTITELQLRETVEDTLNVPVDDTLQSYRITIAMIKAWILATGNVVTATIGNLAVTTAKLAAGAVTDQKTAFTAPTITRLTSGSGTYNVPAGAKWLKVKAQGSGGSGSNSGTAARVAGNNGAATTFGTSLISAGGGFGGLEPGGSASGGAGGTNTVNSPAITLVNCAGTVGEPYAVYNQSSQFTTGTTGGKSIFGGTSSGSTPDANSGSGGSGAPTGGTAALKGIGGGSGGYVEAIIPATLASSYAYSVGAGGTAIGAGTNGNPSYAGAAGVLIIEEYYQ